MMGDLSGEGELQNVPYFEDEERKSDQEAYCCCKSLGT